FTAQLLPWNRLCPVGLSDEITRLARAQATRTVLAPRTANVSVCSHVRNWIPIHDSYGAPDRACRCVFPLSAFALRYNVPAFARPSPATIRDGPRRSRAIIASLIRQSRCFIPTPWE